MTQTTTFTARIASAAMLALAALPIAALTTAAHAATTVRVGDLNLATDQGLAAFHQRANHAAQTFCADQQGVAAERACRKGVKVELTEKMAILRDAQLAKSQPSFAAR